MEANKEKGIGYAMADCCAICKSLAPTVWGEGVDNSWCMKHDEQVWIDAICDSFEPEMDSNE